MEHLLKRLTRVARRALDVATAAFCVSMMAIMVTLAIGVTWQVLDPPTVDRDGYWRDHSLLDLFAPPVEGAYRASIIKSIQTGTITIADASSSNTATITSVDVNNSVVMFMGNSYSGATSVESAGSALCYVVQTNATTVTATRGFTGDGGNVICAYQTLEFYANVLKQAVQRGVITMAAGDTTKDATLSNAVVLAKSVLINGGWTPTDTNVFGGATHNKLFPNLTFNSTTTVRLTRAASGTFTPVAPYQVLEFKG